MNPSCWQRHSDGVILSIRVTPKSSRSAIVGRLEDEIKIALNAPPAEGKANKELIRLLSKTFQIPKSQIEFISGEQSRSKRLLLHGLSETMIKSVLCDILPEK